MYLDTTILVLSASLGISNIRSSRVAPLIPTIRVSDDRSARGAADLRGNRTAIGNDNLVCHFEKK